MVALALEFDKRGGGDCLDFRDDMVGLLHLYYLAQGGTVEHIEYIVAVRGLHCRGIGILVTGNDFYAEALQFDCHFFAEFATAEQQGFAAYLCHY